MTKRDADSFQRKVFLITQNSRAAARSSRLTPVSESELNAYLKFHARDQIPTGVVDPYVNILGKGRLAGRAMVDLDDVRRKQGSGGWFDPITYLTGRLPVTATGVLETKAGVGRFQLESAAISGISVPKWVLQDLVSYYSRSSDDPDGINLDDPFQLPAQIREIRVGVRQAVVVQ